MKRAHRTFSSDRASYRRKRVLRRSWFDGGTSTSRTLESAGRVDRFDRFTVANASGPTSLFRSVGGFDERFVEYGFEDFELGYRLLAADVTILFDRGAIAWHPDVVSRSQMIARNRHVGAKFRRGWSSCIRRPRRASSRTNRRRPWRSSAASMCAVHKRLLRWLEPRKGCPSRCSAGRRPRERQNASPRRRPTQPEWPKSTTRDGSWRGCSATTPRSTRHVRASTSGRSPQVPSRFPEAGNRTFRDTALSIDPPVGTATACAPGAPT